MNSKKVYMPLIHKMKTREKLTITEAHSLAGVRDNDFNLYLLQITNYNELFRK